MTRTWTHRPNTWTHHHISHTVLMYGHCTQWRSAGSLHINSFGKEIKSQSVSKLLTSALLSLKSGFIASFSQFTLNSHSDTICLFFFFFNSERVGTEHSGRVEWLQDTSSGSDHDSLIWMDPKCSSTYVTAYQLFYLFCQLHSTEITRWQNIGLLPTDRADVTKTLD